MQIYSGLRDVVNEEADQNRDTRGHADGFLGIPQNPLDIEFLADENVCRQTTLLSTFVYQLLGTTMATLEDPPALNLR